LKPGKTPSRRTGTLKQKFTFYCPKCKKDQTVDLTTEVIGKFEVKCPECGVTVMLSNIKGFKQFKVGRLDPDLSRIIERDARDRSNN